MIGILARARPFDNAARRATNRLLEALSPLRRRLHHERDELATLPDSVRADLNLPTKPPWWRDELRFIAMPDRLDTLPPGRSPRRRR